MGEGVGNGMYSKFGGTKVGGVLARNAGGIVEITIASIIEAARSLNVGKRVMTRTEES